MSPSGAAAAFPGEHGQEARAYLTCQVRSPSSREHLPLRSPWPPAEPCQAAPRSDPLTARPSRTRRKPPPSALCHQGAGTLAFLPSPSLPAAEGREGGTGCPGLPRHPGGWQWPLGVPPPAHSRSVLSHCSSSPSRRFLAGRSVAHPAPPGGPAHLLPGNGYCGWAPPRLPSPAASSPHPGKGEKWGTSRGRRK